MLHNTDGFVYAGKKWGGDLGTGAVVSWSIMPDGVDMGPLYGHVDSVSLDSFLSFDYETVIDDAFDMWAEHADLEFVRVDDSGAPFNELGAFGDIRIGGLEIDGFGNTLGRGYYPPPNGASAAGDILIDSLDSWMLGTMAGGVFDFQKTILHEIGHALGLDHPEGVSALMNANYFSQPAKLTSYDIEGIRYIYGGVPDAGVLAWGWLLGLVAWRASRRYLAGVGKFLKD